MIYVRIDMKICDNTCLVGTFYKEHGGSGIEDGNVGYNPPGGRRNFSIDLPPGVIRIKEFPRLLLAALGPLTPVLRGWRVNSPRLPRLQ